MKAFLLLCFVAALSSLVVAQSSDGFCSPNAPQDPDCRPGPIHEDTINDGYCDPWEFGTGAPDCNGGIARPDTVNDGYCDPWEFGTVAADCGELENIPPVVVDMGVPAQARLLEGENFARVGVWVRAQDSDGVVTTLMLTGSHNVRFETPLNCAGLSSCTVNVSSSDVFVNFQAQAFGSPFETFSFVAQAMDDRGALSEIDDNSAKEGTLLPPFTPPPPLTPPTIMLFEVPQSPFAGEQFTIRAQARDSNGMSRLELWQGSNVETFNCNSQQTCSATFTRTAPGPNVEFSYELRAYDMQGARATETRSGTAVSRPAEVLPEIISFTGVPATAQPGEAFTIEVTATDDAAGTIIALLFNGDTIDSTQCTTNECTLTTTATAPDSFGTPYEFVAIATDAGGLQDTETRSGRTVQGADGAPVITLFDVPEVADPGELLSIPVAATDDVRLVSLELHYQGNVIDSADCSSSSCDDMFEFTAPATFDTEYVLTLVATDSDGNADVESRSGTTRRVEGPTIDQFDFPTKVKPSEEFTIVVTASDDEGVQSIEIQFDGQDPFTCDENPCTVFSTVTAPAGFDAAYTYTVIVTDSDGLQSKQQKSGRTMKEGEVPQHDPSIDSFTVPSAADAGTEITIKVDASDEDGDLERIELHHENEIIASKECSGKSCALEASFTLPNLFDTVFEFIAKVFDSKNNDDHDHAAVKTNPKPQPPIEPPVLPSADDEPEEESLHSMLSSSVVPEKACVAPGEDLYIFVSLSNKGEQTLRDVKFKLTIPELSAYESVGPFRLREDEKESRFLPLYIGPDAPSGIYYIQFSATADDDKVVKYREIEVNPRCKY